MEQPDSSRRASVDNRDAASQYRRMEDRMAVLERTVAVMQADIATIRSNYATSENVAELKASTKLDLAEMKAAIREEIAELEVAVFKAINAQTWRLVTWVTAVMGAYSAVIYLIARNVH